MPGVYIPQHQPKQAQDQQSQMGIWWPAADSDKLRAAARAWRDMATALDAVDAASQSAVLNLLADNQGPAMDAFGTYWQKWASKDGYLPTCADACRKVATALEGYAQAVDDARLKVKELVAEIGTAVVLGVVLGVCTVGIATAAAGSVTLGLVAAAADVGIVLGETAAGFVSAMVVGATFGAVEAMAIDAGPIQAEKIWIFKDQKEFNWNEVWQWGEMGAAGGFIGGGLSASIGAAGDVLPTAVSDAMATRLGRVVIGGTSGAATSATIDEFQYGQINPLDVVAGAAGGAAGGGIRVRAGATTAPEFAPLSERAAASFRGGAYGGAVPEVLPEARIYNRAGTADEPLGEYLSTDRPVSVIQVRIDKAIPPVWPNGRPAPLDTGWAIRVPKGTVVWNGETASQGDWYMGGTNQVYVPNLRTIPGVEVVGEPWPLQ